MVLKHDIELEMCTLASCQSLPQFLRNPRPFIAHSTAIVNRKELMLML